MRGTTEGGSQATLCPGSKDSLGQNVCSERGIPPVSSKQLQMCAWPTATVHIWARFPARLPSRRLSPPRLVFTTTSLRSALEKQLGRHMAGGDRRSPAAAAPQYRGRPEKKKKSIILAARRKYWAEGNFGGILEGRDADTNSASGGQRAIKSNAGAARRQSTASEAPFQHACAM